VLPPDAPLGKISGDARFCGFTCDLIDDLPNSLAESFHREVIDTGAPGTRGVTANARFVNTHAVVLIGYEGVFLFRRGEIVTAIACALASVLIGFSAVWLALRLTLLLPGKH